MGEKKIEVGKYYQHEIFGEAIIFLVKQICSQRFVGSAYCACLTRSENGDYAIEYPMLAAFSILGDELSTEQMQQIRERTIEDRGKLAIQEINNF